MKKLIACVVSSLVITTAVSAKFDLVTIDTNRLLKESSQGKALQREIEKKAKEIETRQQELMEDLKGRQENLSTMVAALSPEAQEAEVTELRMAQHRAKRELEGMQEDVRLFAQTKEASLRRELNGMAKDLAKEKSWGAVLDESHPLVLATAEEADVTGIVLGRAADIYKETHKVASAPTTVAAA